MRDGWTGRILLVGVAFLVTVAGLLTGTGSARADDPVQVMLLLDVSGSMNEKVAAGETRLAAAKTALKQVADGLPAGTQVGLRVYGSKIAEPKEENPKACQDTELVMPVGPLDRGRMYGAVDSFKAVGETPIAYSLEQTVKDFSGDGRRVVVLVSDGEENCVKDPCAVARKLAGAGVELQFNAIGFNVNDKARKQLQCIVDLTDGSYYDAEDAEDLTESLKKLTQRALRPFALSGTKLQGSTDPEAPADLRPGQYLESFDTTGDTKYYRIDRTPGSAVSIGMSAIMPKGESGFSDIWELRLLAEDDTLCDSDSIADESIAVTGIGSGSVTTTGTSKACAQAPLVLEVKRMPSTKNAARMEMVVFEEPPITNLAELPPSVGKVGRTAPVGRQKGPKPVVGGVAFSDAPALEPGSYLDELALGETVVYKVAAQPGQRIRATLDAPRPGSDWQLTGIEAVGPEVVLLSPSRAVIAMENTAIFRTQTARVTVGTPEIRIRNRESGTPLDDDTTLLSTSRGGDYYLAVRLDTNDAGLIRTVLPIQLNVAVDGEPAGLPVYASSSASPSATPPASPATTPGPTDPASPGPGATPSELSGGPGAGGPGVGGAALIVAGILGVLIIAGIVLTVVLRRRRGTGSD